MADAARIAARVAGGRVTDSEEEWAATGLTYELDVERTDGIDRRVVVDSRNGRVLANWVTDRPDRPGDSDRWEHDGPDDDDD
jgi:uncharacterized membrane protein YkoI